MRHIQDRASLSIERELQKITLADVLRELKAGEARGPRPAEKGET
jgi:hypothetical protein